MPIGGSLVASPPPLPMLRTLAALAVLGAPALASAQPGSTTRVGFGVRLESSPISLPSQGGFGAAPSTVFSVPLDVSGVVRVEPEVGYASFSQEQGNQERLGRQTSLGLAVSALVPANDVTLTAGGRVRYVRSRNELDFGGPDTFDQTVSALAVGPVVGGEYPFSRRFAIGGEVGLEYRSFSVDEESDPNDDFDASSVGTAAAFTVRFFL